LANLAKEVRQALKVSLPVLSALGFKCYKSEKIFDYRKNSAGFSFKKPAP